MKEHKFSIHSIHMRIMIIFSFIFFLAFSSLVLISEHFTEYFFVLNNKNVIIEKSKDFAPIAERGLDPETARDFAVQFGGNVILLDSQGKMLPGNNRGPSLETIPDNLLALMGEQEDYFDVVKSTTQDPRAVGVEPHYEKGVILYALKLNNGNLMVVTKHLGFALESGRIFKRMILYSSVVIYMIAVLVIFIVSKKITQPITKAQAITSEFAKLDLDKRLDEERKDEIGALNKSINFMASELSKNIEALNKELSKERTLDTMRRRFVSDVSHELKNPISMIQGYADALMNHIPKNDVDQMHYYQTISEEAQHMNHIVKDLLDLSSYESGVFNIEKESFDLVLLFKNINARYSHHLTEKQLNLEIDMPDEKIVHADRLRIAQVIINLLSNAYKHVDDQGVIKLEIKSMASSKVKLIVSNTGDLIPEKELEFLFDSFYKVASNKRGHGLGLAIVKSIVKLHDGSCKAYTKSVYNCFEVVI